MSKPYIIICEGTKSGYEYLQKLAIFLTRELCIQNTSFKVIPIGSGHYDDAIRKYKEIYRCYVNSKKPQNKKKINKILKENFVILVDYDTYKRNDLHDFDKYQKKSEKIPNFTFHYFNFEDFLIMHYDYETFEKWYKICKEHNHFNVPMHAEEYIKLIQDHIFPNYDKSSLPEDFSFNEETLKNLFKHNGKYEFKSDFAELLEDIICKENKK